MRFSLKLLARIFFLLTTLCTFAYIFGDERLIFNHVILLLIIIGQVVELNWFVHQTNRELTRLFEAIRHQDFSITFRHLAKQGKSFQTLQHSLNDIIHAYHHVKIEKEAQYQFLHLLVNQLHVGIISLENRDHITLMNPMAENLLDVKGIKYWKHIAQHCPAFVRGVAQLGEQGRTLMELQTRKDARVLSLDVCTVIVMDQAVKLITFQDIDAEVAQKEIEAWHKLTRILTHEIMNSVTPIASLTETIQSMLTQPDGIQKTPDALHEETITDIRFSLHTIYKRSNSLLNFVDTYRQFKRVPKPVLAPVTLPVLLEQVAQLLSPTLRAQGIQLTVENIPHATMAMLDQTQIEQVLINLITNSIHALAGCADPTINLRVYTTALHLVMAITDNGKGIPEKELNDIFIPFFSTKKEGSGIGLSLSKQIVSLHGGLMKVRSQVGTGTTVEMLFKKSTIH